MPVAQPDDQGAAVDLVPGVRPLQRGGAIGEPDGQRRDAEERAALGGQFETFLAGLVEAGVGGVAAVGDLGGLFQGERASPVDVPGPMGRVEPEGIGGARRTEQPKPVRGVVFHERHAPERRHNQRKNKFLTKLIY